MDNIGTSLVGFRYVPGVEHLLINAEGKVFDARASCFYDKTVGGYEYPAINAYGIGTLHIHRLLALAYLHCPGDPAIFEVNHIDGDKSNNKLDNLEWVTVSENVIHAYKTGLRSDNKPVLIKDLSTGNIERVYSLQECARKFKVNGEQVSRYINNRDLYPFRGQYELVFEGDEWRGLTKCDIGKVRPGRPQGVVGLEFATKALYVFNSMQSAAEHLKVTGSTVSMYCHRTEKKLLNGFILWPLRGFKDSLDNSIYVEKEIPKPLAPRRKPLPVVVVNVETAEKSEWGSVEAFGNAVGVSKNTIQKSMSVNDGRWRKFHITYCPLT